MARTLLLISPAIPVMLAVWAIARHFRRMDEFVRLRSLEGLAIAAAVTAGLSLTYGFLESAGFPKLSMFWVWGVMGLVWGAHSLPALRVLAMKNRCANCARNAAGARATSPTSSRFRGRPSTPSKPAATTPACRSPSPSRSCSANRSKRSFLRRNNHEIEDFRGPRARALPARARVFRDRRNSKPARCRSRQISDKGPALIFIPGLACGPWTWTQTAARLEGKYTVYLLTLPGFDGRTPVPGATLESLSRDLRDADRDAQDRQARAHRPQPGWHAVTGFRGPSIPI